MAVLTVVAMTTVVAMATEMAVLAVGFLAQNVVDEKRRLVG